MIHVIDAAEYNSLASAAVGKADQYLGSYVRKAPDAMPVSCPDVQGLIPRAYSAASYKRKLDAEPSEAFWILVVCHYAPDGRTAFYELIPLVF